MSSLLDIRRQARQRKLSWPAVQAAYRDVKRGEWEKRQHPNAVRESAWSMVSTPGSWGFWRHGFLSRWGRKIAQGHDYTIVPRYDEVGQVIGGEFPEYATDDGTQRLFEFLFSPYDKLPTTEAMYRDALDLAEYWARTHPPKQPESEAMEF